jgi:hypothetical protein
VSSPRPIGYKFYLQCLGNNLLVFRPLFFGFLLFSYFNKVGFLFLMQFGFWVTVGVLAIETFFVQTYGWDFAAKVF